jgi:ankyrin repeat protein
VNLTTYIDKLSSLFMDIGRSAPRHEAIGLLYPQSKMLQSHLTEYFIVVVGLCHYLFKFGQKSTVQQLTSSLSDSHLKTFQVDLDRWANLIKEQMHVNEAQESSEFRTFTKTMFKSVSNQQRRATKIEVLDFCSKYDHEADWKLTRKIGNTTMYTRQPEYAAWRDSSNACTLLYTGKLGSGKSVLLANIVQDLSLHTGKEHLAYFFCRHDVPKSLLARTILGSLARQLLRTVSDLSVPAESCEATHSTELVDKVLEVLFQGFPSDAKAYFVLDGLDECDKKEKETLVQAIRQIQGNAKLLVCASFREEANNDLQSVAKQFMSTSVVSMPTENPDIEAFIEADLERCLLEGRLTIGDPALILEIQDALLKGSQGMFLWVALQIMSLCSVQTDHAIREALTNLPKDLAETFARILKRSGDTDPTLQLKTLQLVLAAYRPLTTEELREALSVTPGDATWDTSRLLNNVDSALACCGCLLVVDEEEFTVRVVHHSFKQYIFGQLNSQTSLNITLPEAQRTLADIVVTYLGYGVFGTELSRAKVQPMMAQSTPSKIVQATIGSSNATSRLATRLLRSRRQPAIDMSRAIAEARRSSNSNSQHTFRFYTYAQTHCWKHVFYTSRHSAAIQRLCSKLIYARSSELSSLGEPYWTHILFAAKNGNKDILALLHDAGRLDVTPKGFGGRGPLMLAASMGDSDAVKVLLSVGKPDVNAKNADYEEQTVLMLAAQCGHIDIVEMLLTVGEADVEARDIDGCTALMIAVRWGRRLVVEVLLRVGQADVEATDNSKHTPLLRAIKRRDVEILKLLLTVGKASVEVKDIEGHTALMKAVQSNYVDLVKVLLTIGKANVEARNNRGYTALISAVEMGWAEIVELLLSVRKADVEAKDNEGHTALMLAVVAGRVEIVELLLRVGEANVEAKDNEGHTALMFAADDGVFEVVELLLRVGKADIKTKDGYGQTALERAKRRTMSYGKYDDVIRLLESHSN